MSTAKALDELQSKLGAGCGTRNTTSAAALRDHIASLLESLGDAVCLDDMARRLRRADQLEAAYFELLTADLLRRAGAAVDFLKPPGADLRARFTVVATEVYVEVTSLAFADALRPGRHFVSDDATDAMIAQRSKGVHTLQAALREQGCGGSSLVSRLRGAILTEIEQLPVGPFGVVVIVRPLGQQLFNERVFSLALWGEAYDAIYEGQTRRVQVPVWQSSGPPRTRPDAVIVLTPSMGFQGLQVPRSPGEWRFLTTAFMLTRSVSQLVVARLGDAGVVHVPPPEWACVPAPESGTACLRDADRS